MKKLLLRRSVSQGRAGEVVAVRDDVARALLACPGLGADPTAVLLEDLGEDEPVRPARVKLLHSCSANGSPHPEGTEINVTEADARLLVAIGKAVRVDRKGGEWWLEQKV